MPGNSERLPDDGRGHAERLFSRGHAGFSGYGHDGYTLRAKNASGEVYTCAYDAKSYFEFAKQRVKVDQLREGDSLEVLAYRRAGETELLRVVPAGDAASGELRALRSGSMSRLRSLSVHRRFAMERRISRVW